MASEKFPAATREAHDDFCTYEGWTLVRGSSGKPVTHHRTYELALWDGRVLRTRISRPIYRTNYALGMWSHILREQLQVSQTEFWLCARDGVRPDRGEPMIAPARKSVPLYLVRELTRLGVAESDILELDAAAAARLYAERLAEQ